MWRYVAGAVAAIAGAVGAWLAVKATAEELLAKYNSCVADYYEDVDKLKEDMERVKAAARADVTNNYFEQLRSMYVASIKCADKTYEAKDYSREIIKSITTELHDIKEKMAAIYDKTKASNITYNEKTQLHGELQSLKAVKEHLAQLLEDHKNDHATFLDRVRKFNMTTMDLRLFIRNNCGTRGIEWYDRIEERKAYKRANGL